MNATDIGQILLGVGGTAGIGGLFTVWRNHRKGKLEDEETLIKRLDADNKDKDRTIERLNKELNSRTNERNKAWNQAARFRVRLESRTREGEQIEELVEFND